MKPTAHSRKEPVEPGDHFEPGDPVDPGEPVETIGSIFTQLAGDSCIGPGRWFTGRVCQVAGLAKPKPLA